MCIKAKGEVFDFCLFMLVSVISGLYVLQFNNTDSDESYRGKTIQPITLLNLPVKLFM